MFKLVFYFVMLNAAEATRLAFPQLLTTAVLYRLLQIFIHQYNGR